MAYRTVAILVPGEMGAAVGNAFVSHGLDVLTCLAGRSEATRERAAAAGFRDASLEELLAEAEIVLSILPPELAPAQAARVAAAMRTSGHTPPYADCNAVSPGTARAMQGVIEGAGAVYIDGGIVGSPPGKSSLATRFYVSGADAELMNGLDGLGIDVRHCGPEIGRGVAVKMCYAGITKATSALHAACLLAAEQLGVADEIHAELAASVPAMYKRMENVTSALPAVAGRYTGEMKEIARTMESAGVTPNFHIGATELYQLLERSPFASERRDTVDPDRTLRQTIEACARALPPKSAAQ